MDLTKLPKTELLAELERRKAEENAAELKRRKSDATLALKNIDSLLSLVPEHSRTSCSDENACNGSVYAEQIRCTRCFLLNAKKDEYWDEQCRLTIYVNHLDAL